MGTSGMLLGFSVYEVGMDYGLTNNVLEYGINKLCDMKILANL